MSSKVLTDDPLSSIIFRASRTAVRIIFLRGSVLRHSTASTAASSSGQMGLGLFFSDPSLRLSSSSSAPGVEGLADELGLAIDSGSLSMSAKLSEVLSLPTPVAIRQFSLQCRNSVVLLVALPWHRKQGQWTCRYVLALQSQADMSSLDQAFTLEESTILRCRHGY